MVSITISSISLLPYTPTTGLFKKFTEALNTKPIWNADVSFSPPTRHHRKYRDGSSNDDADSRYRLRRPATDASRTGLFRLNSPHYYVHSQPIRLSLKHQFLPLPFPLLGGLSSSSRGKCLGDLSRCPFLLIPNSANGSYISVSPIYYCSR